MGSAFINSGSPYPEIDVPLLFTYVLSCTGSLGTAVLEPELSMVGASAGVYALIMAHLSNIFYVSVSTSTFTITTTVIKKSPLLKDSGIFLDLISTFTLAYNSVRLNQLLICI